MTTRVTSNRSSIRQPLRVRFDRFELDEGNAQLLHEGTAIPLAPTPFAVLCALARKPGSLLTTNALLDEVWGHQFVTDSVLRTAISELRTALTDDARKPRFIETVSRRGYRFIANAAPRLSAPDTVQSSSFAETQSSLPTLIGRSNELECLRSAWRQAAAGKRQLVWIAGEAGVGKTALIERFIPEIGNALCAHGHCVEQQGTGEPYLPVLEALTGLCRRDATLPELIRAVAPSWLLRLPWLCSAAERDSLRGELAGAGDVRMLREMGELLDRYTHDRPLLLVTEDLHCSDRATVQLMDYMARRRGSAHLLWLASFRLTEIIAADHPLNSVRRELRLHGVSKEIVLDAFSEVDVAELLARRLPDFACDEAFVRALHDRTDGLPLFVSEVVNELAGGGEEAGVAGATRGFHRAWTIPEPFTDTVERYVAELGRDRRLVLEAASICGVDFGAATVAHMLGADVASVAEACAELARGQRWLKHVPSGRHGAASDRYRFSHALYREVLYERIGSVARAELHRKLAACVEVQRKEGGEGATSHRRMWTGQSDGLLPAPT